MTRSFLTLGAAVVAVSAFSATQAAAAVVYSTDFTSADGFTEGSAINDIDGWIAQTQLTSTGVAANGQLEFGANFVRGFNGSTAFNVGDVITVSASVKSIGGSTPGFDANLFRMGLSTASGSGDLGGAGVGAGVNLGGRGATAPATGGVFTLQNLTGGTKTDTIAIDSSFHTLTSTITKLAAANQFSVTSAIDGVSVTSTVTDAGLYNAAAVTGLVFSQGASNTGGIALDSFSVDRVAVPEPATAALLGLGGLAMLGRRRKTA